MQTFISKYGLAAHLALLAVTPLFLCPFCEQGTIAVSMLWMALVAAIWIVMEPSRRNDERLYEARVRVWGGLIRDPFLWLFLVLICFAAIRTFNGDISRLYDVKAAKWVLDEPLSTLLPRAAAGDGFFAFSLVVSLAVLLTGCRQALGKSARIALVAVLSFLIGVMALVLIVCCRLGEGVALEMVGAVNGLWPENGLSIDSPVLVSSLGFVFGLASLGALVSSAGIFECKWNKFMVFFSFGIGASVVGVFYFATPAVMMLTLGLWGLVLVGCVAYVALTQKRSALFRFLVVLLLAAGIPVVVVLGLAPTEMTEFRWHLFQEAMNLPGGLFPADFWERRATLSTFARSFWQENPWLGGGIGSFHHNLWLAGAAKESLDSSGTLNGWWYLLAERGMIGALAVIMPICFMTVTLVCRAVRAWGRHIFLPLPILGVLSLVATVVLTFFDCSGWRAETLLVAGAFYALAASSFPAPRKRNDDEDAVN